MILAVSSASSVTSNASAAVEGGTAYYRRFGLCHGEMQAWRILQGHFRRG